MRKMFCVSSALMLFAVFANAAEKKLSGPDAIDPIMGDYAGVCVGTDGRARPSIGKMVAEGQGQYRCELFVAADTQKKPKETKAAKKSGGKKTSKSPLWDFRLEVRGKVAGGHLTLIGKTNESDWRGNVAKKSLSVCRSDGKVQFNLLHIHKTSPTEAQKPPKGAIVLLPFKPGQKPSLAEWTNTNWIPMSDGSMRANKGSTLTRRAFGDMKLHLEFMIPYMPDKRGQGRGNSGVYIQNRYEVQVLDSFGLIPHSNDCGGLYKIAAPTVNACFPPLSWQTYDITFYAPQFGADGRVTKLPVITVVQNGIMIHDHVTLPESTAGGAGGFVEKAPFQLQDHGCPVKYRNIWVVELKKRP